MKFKSVFVIFVPIFLFVSMAHAPVSSAMEPEDLDAKIEQVRHERDALVAEQKRLQAELNAISGQSQSLATAVKSLDATRAKLANDIKITQSKIASANLDMKMLASSADEKGQQIITHKKAIASVLQELSIKDSGNLLLDILAHDQISDVWGDRARLESLNENLSQEVNVLRQTRQVLDKEKVLTEKTKQELLELQDELGGQKKVVENSQSAKAKLLAETKSKEAEYQRMLAENIARQKQFEDELYKFESQLKVNLDPTLVPAPKAGVLSWPLDYVYITQRFGKTVGAERLYASGTHNGVDFRAAQGTPVKAMLDGVVAGVGNTDIQRGCYSYGRWVLIKYPNGLTSIYGHLSAATVKQGQAVSTGQVVGYSGGTPRTDGAGYSTGPHLHVGLFASQGVEVRQFTQSIGCKQVFVPIADPKAYLDPLAYLPSSN
jgi:murein DD-endopeptidase MepM/ murein hydrolase activator NlpD